MKWNIEPTEEADLETFFAAARQATPPPLHGLLTAILADAREIDRMRRLGAGERARSARQRFAITEVFDWLGGWPVAGAVGACALIGFGLGVGAGDLIVPVGAWSDASVLDAAGDPIADFFDLAAAEG